MNSKLYGYLDHMCIAAPQLFSTEDSREGVTAAAFARAQAKEVEALIQAHEAVVRTIFSAWHTKYLDQEPEDVTVSEDGGEGAVAPPKASKIKVKAPV
jgi:hypothetical protein